MSSGVSVEEYPRLKRHPSHPISVGLGYELLGHNWIVQPLAYLAGVEVAESFVRLPIGEMISERTKPFRKSSLRCNVSVTTQRSRE